MPILNFCDAASEAFVRYYILRCGVFVSSLFGVILSRLKIRVKNCKVFFKVILNLRCFLKLFWIVVVK